MSMATGSSASEDREGRRRLADPAPAYNRDGMQAGDEDYDWREVTFTIRAMVRGATDDDLENLLADAMVQIIEPASQVSTEGTVGEWTEGGLSDSLRPMLDGGSGRDSVCRATVDYFLLAVLPFCWPWDADSGARKGPR